MKTLQATSIIDLDSNLSSSQPIIVTAPSFSGQMCATLKLESADGLNIVSIGNRRKEARPYYFTHLCDIPQNFFTVVKLGEDFIVLFCLSHSGVSAYLEGDGEKCVLCLQGHVKKSIPVLICVHGSNLHQTIGLAMRMGIKQVSRSGKLKEEKPPVHHWLKALGWESGGAFGKDVTHDKILSAVWGLRQQGIQPGYVLIDEGWQKTVVEGGRRLLSGFEADADKFPMGLAGLVKELQRAGVHHVGVAHSILGCEGGLSNKLIEKYKLSTNENEKGFLGFDLGKTFQFYHDYYKVLSEEGVSFSKVKRQTEADRVIGGHGLMDNVYFHLQSAVQAASSLHFEAPHLNSECVKGANIFYWTTSRIAVTADDLDAQTPTGTKKAIRNLLTNACWLQHLMHTDFNSWTTHFPSSDLLAILHSVSGSINMISDPPGKTQIDLLKKSVLPSGRLIQSDFPLTICSSSFFKNPLTTHELFRAFSFKEETGLLVLFNLTRKKKPVQENISSLLIEGIAGERFAVYSHQSGFLGVYQKDEPLPIALKQNEADILTFSPIRDGVALIGCYSFFVPRGPIQETTFEEESMHISSIVASPMLMYSERNVMDIRRNGQVIPWDYDEDKKLLVIDSRQSQSEISTVYTINFE